MTTDCRARASSRRQSVVHLPTADQLSVGARPAPNAGSSALHPFLTLRHGQLRPDVVSRPLRCMSSRADTSALAGIASNTTRPDHTHRRATDDLHRRHLYRSLSIGVGSQQCGILYPRGSKYPSGRTRYVVEGRQWDHRRKSLNRRNEKKNRIAPIPSSAAN